MKKQLVIYPLLIGIFVTGCATKTEEQTCALAGTEVSTGAAIGGGTGAIVGDGANDVGVIGTLLDKQDQKNLRRRSPATYNRVDQGEPLTVNNIISLGQANISDKKIIELIKKTDSRYVLSTHQIDRMQRAGVTDRIINYMIQT